MSKLIKEHKTNLQLVEYACEKHFKEIRGQYILRVNSNEKDIDILTIANPDIFESLFGNLYVDLFVNVKKEKEFKQPEFNIVCIYVKYLPTEN